MSQDIDVDLLKNLPPPSSCVYVDIETDNLLLNDITKFHSICITTNTGEELKYSTLKSTPPIDEGIRFLEILVKNHGLTPVFHNGAGYDLRVIHKFYPDTEEWLTIYNTVDTMLLSCILEPDRDGGHSLDAWGESFGIPKVQNEDWTTCTEHMVNRCVVDTVITQKVYEYLFSLAGQYVRESIFSSLTLESEVSHIHQKQANWGVLYDVNKAMEHYNFLDGELKVLKKKIQENAPWKTEIFGIAKKNQLSSRNDPLVMNAKIVSPFKKDGTYAKRVVDYWGDKDVQKVKGPYVRIICSPLDLGNPAEVKKYLLSLGWKPTEYNYSFENGRKVRKSPKLTEDSYDSLPEGLGRDIATYNTYQHRQRSILNINEKTGEVKGALSNVREDGRITAEAFTCGTPTARYRHAGTVCNIPRPSSVFGGEIRETFCVDDMMFLIGIDLSGIESRMLAHYLLAYVDPNHPLILAILDDNKGSDFHSRNAQLWGVDRNTAKSGLYALMYGCFPKKLAQTLGYPESEGQRLYDDFWAHNEPIRLLVEDLEESLRVNGKFIRGLDGRPLFIREKRKLLNSLLQNAATVVFKRWMVMTDEYIRKNPELHQVIAYHDELQIECRSPERYVAQVHSQAICKLALEAGEYYGVKVPTPAEANIGKSWRDTH